MRGVVLRSGGSPTRSPCSAITDDAWYSVTLVCVRRDQVAEVLPSRASIGGLAEDSVAVAPPYRSRRTSAPSEDCAVPRRLTRKRGDDGEARIGPDQQGHEHGQQPRIPGNDLGDPRRRPVRKLMSEKTGHFDGESPLSGT